MKNVKSVTQEMPPIDELCLFRREGVHPYTGKPYIPTVGYFSKYEKSPSGYMVTVDKWPMHWYIDKKTYTICPFEANIMWVKINDAVENVYEKR